MLSLLRGSESTEHAMYQWLWKLYVFIAFSSSVHRCVSSLWLTAWIYDEELKRFSFFWFDSLFFVRLLEFISCDDDDGWRWRWFWLVCLLLSIQYLIFRVFGFGLSLSQFFFASKNLFCCCFYYYYLRIYCVCLSPYCSRLIIHMHTRCLMCVCARCVCVETTMALCSSFSSKLSK